MKVFHLTEIKNLYGDDGIIAKGLIPQNGERSKSIDDERHAVYFTQKCFLLPVWWELLYPNTQAEDLCVLSFDIPDHYMLSSRRDGGNSIEYYTAFTIPPRKINIARFIDEHTMEEVPFQLLNECRLEYDGNDSKLVLNSYKIKETPIVLLENEKGKQESKNRA